MSGLLPAAISGERTTSHYPIRIERFLKQDGYYKPSDPSCLDTSEPTGLMCIGFSCNQARYLNKDCQRVDPVYKVSMSEIRRISQARPINILISNLAFPDVFIGTASSKIHRQPHNSAVMEMPLSQKRHL
ncbi:predicted protein [Sclerotinia sclerotiorum 1980 UF-70]|uniref:Uncharacterized protein n=1 Tax=Sclerotinia sclerotiorum (strain ATCC 18683 / 1980 / Ss-1) TaxID=665079 RepID=A7EIS9_SCLS1|nr:predicted protein [Sclerotinia sclerotiorum 1980 UF-70]EDO02745.1 predicted protein [Sclerotinia sclerotiorum 1980 UF-70]